MMITAKRLRYQVLKLLRGYTYYNKITQARGERAHGKSEEACF